MIKNKDRQRTELREEICGGIGRASVRHILEQTEIKDMRLFDHVTLEPGATFGTHTHHDEAEIYYVLKGELVTGEAGGEHVLRPGDSSYTGDGAYHYLRNESDEPAEFLAMIVGVGSVTLGPAE